MGLDDELTGLMSDNAAGSGPESLVLSLLELALVPSVEVTTFEVVAAGVWRS